MPTPTENSDIAFKHDDAISQVLVCSQVYTHAGGSIPAASPRVARWEQKSEMEQTESQAAVPPSPGLSPVANHSRPPLGQLLMAAATPVQYASLAVALPLLGHRDRNQWFTGDVFQFFDHMQPSHPLDLFVSHKGHWTTIPFLNTLPISPGHPPRRSRPRGRRLDLSGVACGPGRSHLRTRIRVC
jgi:hypothetical protein